MNTVRTRRLRFNLKLPGKQEFVKQRKLLQG